MLLRPTHKPPAPDYSCTLRSVHPPNLHIQNQFQLHFGQANFKTPVPHYLWQSSPTTLYLSQLILTWCESFHSETDSKTFHSNNLKRLCRIYPITHKPTVYVCLNNMFAFLCIYNASYVAHRVCVCVCAWHMWFMWMKSTGREGFLCF